MRAVSDNYGHLFDDDFDGVAERMGAGFRTAAANAAAASLTRTPAPTNPTEQGHILQKRHDRRNLSYRECCVDRVNPSGGSERMKRASHLRCKRGALCGPNAN